jgi:hypothetical protein
MHAMKKLIGVMIAGLALGATVRGAQIYTETFTGGNSGWTDRDGIMNNDAAGSPAAFNGTSLVGTFALQGTPAPQTDAFRAVAGSSSGNFTGDYWAGAPNFTGFQLSFMAQDIAPLLAGDVQVRFRGNGNTYFFNVGSYVPSIGSMFNISVPLTYTAGWHGNAGAFSNALSNVQWVDVQINRGTTAAQTYYLGSFGLTDTPMTFVPEPGSLMMVLLGSWLVLTVREKRRKQHKARVAGA